MGEYRYYYQTKDYFAFRNEKKFLKSRSDNQVQTLAGSLWFYDPSASPVNDGNEWKALSLEYTGVCLLVSGEKEQQFLCQITKLQYDVLLAVESCHQRLSIVQTEEYKKVHTFEAGQHIDFVSERDGIGCGYIRYIGILDQSAGIWFGIELIGKLRNKGTCNGTFKKKTYFSCDEECAVFANIGRLKFHKNESVGDSPLAMRERVVWISDDGPEFGTVQWIGVLPGSSNKEITVGVEFDRPVGTGTGRYNDVQLFQTRMNHASLVPVLGLMKESDFISSQSPIIVPNEPPTSAKSYASSRQQHMELLSQSALLSRKGPSALRPYEGSAYLGTASKTMPLPSKDKSSDKSIYDRRIDDVRRGQSTDDISSNISDRADGIRWPPGAQNFPEKILQNQSPLHSPSDNLSQGYEGRILQGTTIVPARPSQGDVSGSLLPEYLRKVSKASPAKNADGLNRVQVEVHAHSADFRARGSAQNIQPVAIDPISSGIDLEIGALVEIIGGTPNCRYGTLKWLGRLRLDNNNIYAGIQMEEENEACTDGSFQGVPVFECPMRKAFFASVKNVRRDQRFCDNRAGMISRQDSQRFGKIVSPDVEEAVEPPLSVDLSARRPHFIGRERGIQGHHNSCYLDATLFAMFAFSTAMDSMLFRDQLPSDLPQFEEVQKILRDGIVNPLRKNFYVRADKLMKLRQMLEQMTGGGHGLLGEEKDPEEFLSLLLQQVFQCEPLLKLSTGQSTYLMPLIMEKDASLKVPTTQQLLDRSFYQQGIKLLERPSCLMLQMPRFGKDYKLFEKIIPSLKLDIGGIINDAPRICEMCGQVAACLECPECFEDAMVPGHRFYCNECSIKYHRHPKRTNHRPKSIPVNPEFEECLQRSSNGGHAFPLDEEQMELFGVICIATSHYVSFVKCGTGDNAPWLFFDSMADRVGGQDGYNIPEVLECSDIYAWLDLPKVQSTSDRDMPPLIKRLLCDSYICLYQHPLLVMYK